MRCHRFTATLVREKPQYISGTVYLNKKGNPLKMTQEWAAKMKKKIVSANVQINNSQKTTQKPDHLGRTKATSAKILVFICFLGPL